MSDLQRITDLEMQMAELESLVKEAEFDGDVVGRLSFETRLKIVASELAELRARDASVAEVAILFDGTPVEGSQTIDATFATQALNYFQSVITHLFASNLKVALAARGKIPGAKLAALNIRGIATGSFGFILQEKDAHQTSAIQTPVREALEEAAALFEEFTQENEDNFLIDMNHMNPRVFRSLARFFRHLEKYGATLKTNLPSRQYSFDRAGIERAYRRIAETDVKIDQVVWIGTLVGLSPIKRTFDFKRDGTQEIVSGKFSHQVSQDYLERIESDEGITLGARFTAKIEIGTIRKSDGSISVSYTVTDLVDEPSTRG